MMATRPEGADRRVQRTQKLLQRAILDLMQSKTLAAVSVQEIADRAEVSRGTFYAHYADKYELVEAIIAEDFRRAICPPAPDSTWQIKTLRLLIRAVLDYFKAAYQRHHRSRDFAPILERAIQRELSAALLAMLEQTPIQADSPLSRDMLAHMLSWTIFGAATVWCQAANAAPLETTADAVLAMLMNGITPRLSGE